MTAIPCKAPPAEPKTVEEAIARYRDMAMKMFNRFGRRHCLDQSEIEDGEQVAMMGIVIGFNTHDYSKSKKMSTHIWWRVRGQLSLWVRKLCSERRVFGRVDPKILSSTAAVRSHQIGRPRQMHRLSDEGEDGSLSGQADDDDACEFLLQGLTDLQRDMMYKRYVQGMAPFEIAAERGCTDSNVWQIIESARIKMARRPEVRSMVAM
jgi:RNA polymerase sigma factor (sigma-70 family)